MNLYLIQDNDRPMYVLANQWHEAIEKWNSVIRKENDMEESEEIDGPQGIQLICSSDELIF